MPVGEKVQTIAVFSWHTTFKGMQCKNVRLEIERRFVRLWAWPFLPFPPSFGREMCERIKPPAGKRIIAPSFKWFSTVGSPESSFGVGKKKNKKNQKKNKNLSKSTESQFGDEMQAHQRK